MRLHLEEMAPTYSDPAPVRVRACLVTADSSSSWDRVGAVALVLRGDAALHFPVCPPRPKPRCLLARLTTRSGGLTGCGTDRPVKVCLVARGRCEHWLFTASRRCPFSSRLPHGHAEFLGLCDLPRALHEWAGLPLRRYQRAPTTTMPNSRCL